MHKTTVAVGWGAGSVPQGGKRALETGGGGGGSGQDVLQEGRTRRPSVCITCGWTLDWAQVGLGPRDKEWGPQMGQFGSLAVTLLKICFLNLGQGQTYTDKQEVIL